MEIETILWVMQTRDHNLALSPIDWLCLPKDTEKRHFLSLGQTCQPLKTQRGQNWHFYIPLVFLFCFVFKNPEWHLHILQNEHEFRLFIERRHYLFWDWWLPLKAYCVPRQKQGYFSIFFIPLWCHFEAVLHISITPCLWLNTRIIQRVQRRTVYSLEALQAELKCSEQL